MLDLQAPTCDIAVTIAGKVKPRTPATNLLSAGAHDVLVHPDRLPKVLLMHTAQAMPCSRWMVGNTSAEYWKATGPSPSEYMIVNK